MPYVSRDATGKVYRISTRGVPDAELVPHNHPEVIAFLQQHGQDPKLIEDSLSELRRTDNEMARAVEDIITVLLKKNVIKMTDMPKNVQDRMALRVKLRVVIQDVYDQASGAKS
jgi:hypothetical protein